MKTIVFCADGTWDSPQCNTNVYKLYKALPITSGQVPFYDDGVGSDGTPLEKLTGGAFGAGLFQKIKDGYTKIAQVYEQNDNIFIFGFSRGAYTARSLAGMIAVCGLPTANFDNGMVETAFQAYRNKDQRQTLLSSLGSYSLFDAKITMVGVWDTVGSLGIPALVGGVDPVLFGFLDTSLHPDVLSAFHALAIDERRREFPPTLWSAPFASNQQVQQVWFSGVHCDVGGGYPQTGLSDITLSWMTGKAKALGLQFSDGFLSQYGSLDPKYALDQLHQSWNVLWGFPKNRAIAPTSSLSNSVNIRCEFESAYQPDNLTMQAGLPANTYQGVQILTIPVPSDA